MPFWLDSWAGDNAGNTIGREPNKLLITVTTEGTQYPQGLFQSIEISGFQVYPDIYLECLTPSAVNVYAVNVKHLGGNVYTIGIAQLGTGGPVPFTPGVHLFSISLTGGGNVAATIATAIIDDDMPFVEFHLPPPAFFTFLRQGGIPPQALA